MALGYGPLRSFALQSVQHERGGGGGGGMDGGGEGTIESALKGLKDRVHWEKLGEF